MSSMSVICVCFVYVCHVFFSWSKFPKFLSPFTFALNQMASPQASKRWSTNSDLRISWQKSSHTWCSLGKLQCRNKGNLLFFQPQSRQMSTSLSTSSGYDLDAQTCSLPGAQARSKAKTQRKSADACRIVRIFQVIQYCMEHLICFQLSKQQNRQNSESVLQFWIHTTNLFPIVTSCPPYCQWFNSKALL